MKSQTETDIVSAATAGMQNVMARSKQPETGRKDAARMPVERSEAGKRLKTTHTPSPWRAVNFALVESAEGSPVAHTFSGADAHLIAAAPELLAACKRVIELFERPQTGRQVERAIGAHTIAAMKHIVAKVEGQTE